MAGVPLWLTNIFYPLTFKNCHISHTSMNSWIPLRKKKKAKIWHIWAHFSTWESATQVAAVCFISVGVCSPAHHGPFTFLTSPTWAPVDLNLETLNYNHEPTNPRLRSPLFPFQLIPLSFVRIDFLINTVPKEQISSSFPNFFFPFQLIHPPFLPLSPSHPTELPSQKVENAFGILKYEARFSQNEY